MNKKLVTGLLIASMLPNALPVVTLAGDNEAYIVEKSNESSDIRGGGF